LEELRKASSATTDELMAGNIGGPIPKEPKKKPYVPDLK